MRIRKSHTLSGRSDLMVTELPGQLSVSERNIKAFSLIELLAVIAIISVLAALITPALSNINRSYQLSHAAALIEDNLRLARQLAMTRNLPVIVSFCETSDSLGVKAFNVIQLDFLQPDGSLVSASKLMRLPQGMSISTNSSWSSLMGIENSTSSIQGQPVVSKRVRFRPNGRCALSSSENWFLTVYPHDGSPTPSDNFVTISLDPVTARVGINRP